MNSEWRFRAASVVAALLTIAALFYVAHAERLAALLIGPPQP